MGCHDTYIPCYDRGRTKVCECSRDKRSVLELITRAIEYASTWLSRNRGFYNNVLRDKPKHRCIYSEATINELKSILKCFSGLCSDEELKRKCPNYVICDEEYISKLYRRNGYELKHPDILIIKTASLTLIVEEKSYGKQNLRDFENQIESSYNYLPNELRSPCMFVAYVPRGGGTLPIGYTKHSQLLLLMKNIGRPIIYPIPVLVIERTLLRYLPTSR